MAQNSLRPDLLLALTELLVGRTGMATLRDRADEVDAAACERSTAAGCHSGDEFAAALLGGELGREEVDELVGCRNVCGFHVASVMADSGALIYLRLYYLISDSEELHRLR